MADTTASSWAETSAAWKAESMDVQTAGTTDWWKADWRGELMVGGKAERWAVSSAALTAWSWAGWTASHLAESLDLQLVGHWAARLVEWRVSMMAELTAGLTVGLKGVNLVASTDEMKVDWKEKHLAA